MAPGWPRPLPQILVLGLGLVLMRAAAGEQAPGMLGSEDGEPRIWGLRNGIWVPGDEWNRVDVRICDPWTLGRVFQVGKVSIHSKFYPQSESCFATCPIRCGVFRLKSSSQSRERK